MLIAIFTFITGIMGALIVSYGAWLVYAPAGYLTAGIFLMATSYFWARSAQPLDPKQHRGERE